MSEKVNDFSAKSPKSVFATFNEAWNTFFDSFGSSAQSSRNGFHSIEDHLPCDSQALRDQTYLFPKPGGEILSSYPTPFHAANGWFHNRVFRDGPQEELL